MDTIRSLGHQLRERKLGCVELTRHYLDQIQAQDGELHAFLSVWEESAFTQAEAIQHRLDRGEALSPLAGIPTALKDNLCAIGSSTTAGCPLLESFSPPYDATVVEKLRQAGGIILGKLNMDAFSMDSTTETSYFGITCNPWDNSRVADGSAAAMAAGMVPYALGSDTGGSLRQPCGFCGISGIKPTYGAVSRYGIIAYASSLDQIGPMAQTVEDCALILDTIAGQDCRDATSVTHAGRDFSGALFGDVRGLRIGVPRSYFSGDGEVLRLVEEAARTLESLGAVMGETQLTFDRDVALSAYSVITCTEASSNLSRLDGLLPSAPQKDGLSLHDSIIQARTHGFGLETKQRILLGTYLLGAGGYETYYRKAVTARQQIRQDFDSLFGEFDLLLTPTSPTTAFQMDDCGGDQLFYAGMYTVPVSLAGLPALSVPCGFDGDGMPVGLQLIGPAFSEDVLIRAGHAYQQATDFHLCQPEGRDAL